MLYLVIGLSFFPFLFFNIEKDREFIFKFYFFFISLICCFRFGIGADYFNYYDIYKMFQNRFVFSFEPLFCFCCYLGNIIKLPFPYFMGLWAFISLLLVYKTIVKYSENPLFSLFLFFCVYYCVYFESAIRQGLAISLFVYSATSYLNKEISLKKYFFYVLLASGFHFSAVILFFVPFIFNMLKDKDLFSLRSYILYSIFFLICSFFVHNILVFFISSFMPRYRGYITKAVFNSYSFITIAFNFIKGFVFLFFANKIKENLLNSEKELINFLVISVFIYFCFSSITILSRLAEYFLIFEIIVIPLLLSKSNYSERYILIAVFYFLSILLLFKDLKSFLIYGCYYSNSLSDYPYVSIFNKLKILNYRGTNVDITGLLK